MTRIEEYAAARMEQFKNQPHLAGREVDYQAAKTRATSLWDAMDTAERRGACDAYFAAIALVPRPR